MAQESTRPGRGLAPAGESGRAGSDTNAASVVTTYDRPFSNDREALTQNMLVVGTVKNGGVTFARAEDASRNAIVQRKLARSQ